MRNLGLDLLRIVAVLLVIGRHMHLPDGAGRLLRIWKCGGWVGVDLFFVLSGFLISSLLFKEHLRTGSIDVRRFLIRRGFKIYPAFWVFLAFTVVARFAISDPPPLRGVLGELLFIQNYLEGLWGHTWSLAIEEHFYIGVAILFALAARLRPGHRFEFVPAVFWTLAVVCFGLRLSNLAIYAEYHNHTYLFPTHLRIDSLFFGVFLSYLYNFRQLRERTAWIPSWTLVAVGVLLLSPAFVFKLRETKWLAIGGVTLFYVAGGALLLAAVRIEVSTSRVLRSLGMLGAASYSIYLWHLPMKTWGTAAVRRITGSDSFTLYFVTYVVGSVVLGVLMSRIVEGPALRLRERWFPSAGTARGGAKDDV